MGFDEEDEFGTAPDNETRSRIAAPNAAATSTMPAVSLRGLPAPATGSTEDLESRGTASRMQPAPIAKPSALDTRTAKDESEYGRLQTTGSGISQIKNPFARGALRGLETLGDVFAPRQTAAVPGTEAHHDYLLAQSRGRIGEDLGEAEKEATTAKSGADTEEAQAKARLANAQADVARNPKTGLTPEEVTIHDLMTGENGQPRLNPDTGQPYTYFEAYTAVQQAKSDTKKPTPAHVTYDNGIPVSVVSAKGEVYDVNDPKLPDELKPLVASANKAHGQHVKEEADTQARSAANANARQNKAEDFQQAEKGREHLQKAEDGYREASEKADTLRSVVQAAQSGNMVAGSLQPLLAVLGVTTMEGVKRINNTELENVQGAGSLWDKIKGKVGKLAEGQPIDAELQGDITKLADMLQQSAYTKYQGSHKSITKRYGLSDEEPLAGPGGSGPGSAIAGKDVGAAPAGKAEGSTGKLADGTKVIVKGGRLITQ